MLKENYLLTTYLGFGLFLLGEISNLYHHILLTNLRKETLEYKIPSGGLFPLINCPHYLSEIIAWLGIAIMSRYQLVYGLSFVMSAYLVARSINTTNWYQEKIPSFPKERKSIIPYLI
jgi:very-long-chain enoyl-CoA reductase